MLERAIAICPQLPSNGEDGVTEPACILPRGTLADAYAKAHRDQDALKQYQAVLRESEQAFGKDGAIVGGVLLRIAKFHTDRKQYAQALPLAQRALPILDAQKDKEGFSILYVETLLNLIEDYRALGNQQQAAKYEALYEQFQR